MRVVDAVAEILKREGIEYLSAYPTTILIEAAAAAGIRPILCRQERVGVGIADGYSRVMNGKKLGVFAMQYGPGAENAYPGVTTAFSDSTPLLLLPLGHNRDLAQVFPTFQSVRSYRDVTKAAECVPMPSEIGPAMRRAFSQLRMGRPGPVLVEIPSDVAHAEIDPATLDYRPVTVAQAGPSASDIDAAAQVLVESRRAVIQAGSGVLYAGASEELRELAELLEIPVFTTMEGKSAFPENHDLALGSAVIALTGQAVKFIREADVLFAVGTSLTRHPMTATIPAGKTIIHAANDPRDLHKQYPVDHPILGDAKLVLGALIDAVRDRLGDRSRVAPGSVRAAIRAERERWLAEWAAKLRSDQKPITPYRVLSDFMRTVDPADAIVTHDSGSPRDQILPFYVATTPRGYLGWGKSHQLGTGLGLAIGAKLAAPEKLCVNFMGDAAFGMTGLDFETAARTNLPILTVVFNNSTMAIEIDHLPISHELYQTRDIGGRYADIARALGGWSERVEDPNEIGPAIKRAREATENGKAALLEFITNDETAFSNRRML